MANAADAADAAAHVMCGWGTHFGPESGSEFKSDRSSSRVTFKSARKSTPVGVHASHRLDVSGDDRERRRVYAGGCVRRLARDAVRHRKERQDQQRRARFVASRSVLVSRCATWPLPQASK